MKREYWFILLMLLFLFMWKKKAVSKNTTYSEAEPAPEINPFSGYGGGSFGGGGAKASY